MGSDKKWIYLSYITASAILSWVLDQTFKLIIGYAGGYLHIRNPMVLGVLPASTVIAFVVMGTYAYFYTRQEKVQTFSMEVLQELRKVTWPTKKTAYLSTVVVVVTVIIMAVVMGVFDWVCTRLVGLVLRA